MFLKVLRFLYQRGEGLMVGYVLFMLAVCSTIQVICRKIWGISFDWFDEGARYLLILITFVGASVAVRENRHFAMDALPQALSLRSAHILKLLASLVSALVMGLLTYYAWLQMMKIAHYGTFSPANSIPMWLPYSPLALISPIMSLRFLRQAGYHFKGIFDERPLSRFTQATAFDTNEPIAVDPEVMAVSESKDKQA